MRGRRRGIVRGLCAAAAAVPAYAFAQRPNVELRTAVLPPALVIASPSRPGADWPKYCATLEMTGVARGERLISAASAASIAAAWHDSLEGAIASSPIVVAGVVYVGDWSGKEWALDAATGAVIATADLGTTSVPVGHCNPPDLGITSAPAVSGGALYLAGGDDAFYALDARTLAIRWRTVLGDNSKDGGYYGWCSPAFVDGLVYQGISSNCDNPFIPGAVDALDASTGAIAAAADLARASDRSHDGAGVWTSPAIDLPDRAVFVTTASAYHYDDGYAYSIVRLSLDSLAVEDSWKLSPEDFALAPDADWGSSPTLFTDAAGRRLVGAGQKNGYYYAFRRAALSAGPVWQTALANPGECPQCGDGTLSTAAFDGTRLYVGAGKTPDYSMLGQVRALDPSTGAVIWTFALPGAVIAPISFANGVVFAAGGKRCVALDAETGALLWSFDATSLVYGGIAISNGRIFFGDLAGNLYAFAVPFPAR